MEHVKIETNPTTEVVRISITGDVEDTRVYVTESAESVRVRVKENVYNNLGESWFSLIYGYDAIEELTTELPGDLLRLTYLDGTVYYWYAAYDDSINAVYRDVALTELVARRKITAL